MFKSFLISLITFKSILNFDLILLEIYQDLDKQGDNTRPDSKQITKI
jgi:hypothetical protein